MTTPAQQAANARNAQRSTGPRTTDGKARSAQNARKHGLFAAAAVIVEADGTERPQDFRDLLADLNTEFDPQTRIDRVLVERVAVCFWRLRRAQRFETGAVDQARDDARRRDLDAEEELEKLEKSLARDRAILDDYRQDLQEVEAFNNLNDPHVAEQALPRLRVLASTLAPFAAHLPAPDLRDILRARLYDRIDNVAPRVARLDHRISDEKDCARRNRRRRPLTAALPAPEEVLKLVRYENMLDRQLHRALTRLRQRRRRKEETDPASQKETQ